MRIVVLTSSRKSTASYCIPLLAEKTKAEIVQVIYCQGIPGKNRKYYTKRFKKIWKIGLAGAINGIRIRKWFDGSALKPGLKDISQVCKDYHIPYSESPSVNHADTIKLIRDSGAELGISLSNSYISKKVFSIPLKGMINIHGEVLPAFQNAQSVIWQIYQGNAETGYTIHRIDAKIDTGEILKQEKFPIIFAQTLEQTVRDTVDEILRKAGAGLVDVINNFGAYDQHAIPQGPGKSYTTPSFWQFLSMQRRYKELKKTLGNY